MSTPRVRPSDCKRVDITCPSPCWVVQLPDGRFRAVNAEGRFEREAPPVRTAQEAADYLIKLEADIKRIMDNARR